MAQPDFPHPLTPSILDRLLGVEPPTGSELQRQAAFWIRQRKQSLQRDLENLLNTRWQCRTVPDGEPELPTSLLRYGIPDFTGVAAGSVRGTTDLLEAIRRAIEQYEPRLRRVRVEPFGEDREQRDRVFRFRIEADLVTEDEAEEVAFVSMMEPSSGTFSVDKE